MKLENMALENVLVSVQPGFASGQSVSEGEGALQIRMNNVKPDGTWDWSKKRIVPATENQLARYNIKPGDILFNATNSPEQAGKSALFSGMDQEVTYSNHFLRLRVNKDKVLPEYLIRYFAYLWKLRVFENMVDAWVNQATVRREDLLALEIPLPPLKEQKRIAAIFDKADNLRRKRQQAIELADEFLRAVFLDMFGDPVSNPKGWEMKSLKQMANVITGNTPPRNNPENYGDHIEWIKSGNINTPSHFLTAAEEGLSVTGLQSGRKVPKDSILITCIAGSFDCIGNAAYADREVSFNQQINALIPKDGINNWFLYSLVLFSKKVIQAASTNAMKGMISKSKLEEITLICPTTKEQAKFEKVFKSYLSILNNNQAFHLSNTELFDSINQKSFKGELSQKSAA